MNPYGRRVPLIGMGGKAHPLGYVVIRVQVEGVPEYDEDQVAFVVDDNTTFSWRVPVVLGTPTINRVVAVMKESNLNNSPMEWQASKNFLRAGKRLSDEEATFGTRRRIPHQYW